MRIFITGGCGFIGSNIAEYHLNKGDEVHVIDNLTTGTLKNIEPFTSNPKFKFYEGNILDWPEMEKEVKWAERVYHFAAVVGIFKVISEPINVVASNIEGTRHLLDVIKKSGAKPVVVIASSSSVYGNSPKPLLTETDDLIIKQPKDALATYSTSKLTTEIIALAYYHGDKIPIILPRLFNTVGPRQTGRYGMVVPRFVNQACSNEPLTIFGDGSQTRSFCDVRDSVVALDMIASRPDTIGEIINVGNDYEISINDLAKLVGKCVGHEVEVKYIPYEEAYGMPYQDITQRRPNIAKMKSLIPFKHQWSLEKTVNDLIERFRKK